MAASNYASFVLWCRGISRIYCLGLDLDVNQLNRSTLAKTQIVQVGQCGGMQRLRSVPEVRMCPLRASRSPAATRDVSSGRVIQHIMQGYLGVKKAHLWKWDWMAQGIAYILERFRCTQQSISKAFYIL